MITRRCDYCGRKYAAKTKRSKYCCDVCRVYGNRGKKAWCTSTPQEIKLPAHRAPRTITADQITDTVLQLKEAAVTLDVAALRGPVETRELCRSISDRVLRYLREFGL